MPQTQIDMSPLCPPATSSPLEKLAWLQGSLQRAEASLKNGDAYRTIDETIDLIANRVMSAVLARTKGKKKSTVSINRIKRQLREIISLLTQRIKPRWDYGTQNEAWKEQAEILTKRLKAWFASNLFDRKLKECLQWAVCGAGYLQVGWSRAIPGYMDTDLDVDVLGPDDVLRDQGMEIQEAYGTHIRKLYNLSEAISRFPLSRAYLRPVRTRPTTRAQDARKVTSWLSPLLNAIGFTRTGGDATENVNNYGFLGTDVEVYYTYILDPKINNTGAEIHSDTICHDMVTGIKTAQTSWEYTIPYVGQQLPLDEAGHIRIATAEDCYYYPTRRLLIWTQDHLIYDGPSYFWHGRVPIVQLSMDKWPWEQIGYSLAMDNISIGDAVNQIMRGVVDTFNLKFDPTLMVNGREITRKEMEGIDMREPGGRIMRSGMLPAADVITPINDNGYEIPQQTQPILGLLLQTMDHQVGVADVSSLMELQQAPSADSTERLLQAQGPLATDYARELEKMVTEFGYLAGWNFLQFDTLQKRLKILGQSGLSYEDFNYDPGRLMPISVPGAVVGSTLMQRGLLFGRQFSFQVVPNSIFEFTDTQDKLFKFQLWRDQRFPIDPWTLAEAWNLGNFGTPKAGDIMGRWKEWQDMNVEIQAAIAAKAQIIQQQLLMQGQAEMMQDPRMAAMMQLMQGGGGAPQGGGSSAPPGGGSGHTGRPPSGSKPPHLEAKISATNPRNPTVAES